MSHSSAQPASGLREWFLGLERWLWSQAKAQEELSLTAQIDCADFIRLNQNRVVQASRVDHASVGLGLRKGRLGVHMQLSVSLQPSQAKEQLREALLRLRQWLPCVPEDPYWEPFGPPCQSTFDDSAALDSGAGAQAEDAMAVVDGIRAEAHGLDLVGLYASGPIASAMATNSGHHHWHQAHQSFFDFAVYADKDKAFKDCCFGQRWAPQAFAQRVAAIREQLPILFRPPKRLAPGDVRALLSAQSVCDLLGLACWGGFSARAHLTGQSPLKDLRSGLRRWSPQVTVVDDLEAFGVPLVQENGLVRNARSVVIDKGEFKNWFCSPRTGREFSVPHNLSGGGEGPSGLVLAPGLIPQEDLMAELDTGVYLSNVWYLNYSDRQAGRFTGMSRFASLWVEDGQPVAPVSPFRFDDNFYRLFGECLLGLGREPASFGSTSTYGPRGLGGASTVPILLNSLAVAS